MKFFKQELVFWVVSGTGGQVKKLRFTLGRILGFALIAILVISSLLVVASDYTRMQWIGIKQAFHLESVAEERDTLLNSNEALQTRLEELVASQDETNDFRREVKKRLVELSKVLRSVPSPDLDGAREFVKVKPLAKKLASGSSAEKNARLLAKRPDADSEAVGGMGGAEIPLMRIPQQHVLGRASPMIFEDAEVYSDEMVIRLEQMLTLMRITPLGRPVAGDISSGFGIRWSPFESDMLSRHEGVDFAAPRGTPIMATADGIVTDVSNNSTYGLKVDITHHPELMTRYGHMMAANVTVGQIVRRGDTVGFVGSTGRSTGPHLHYEVRFLGRAVNPEMYLALQDRLIQALQ